MDELRQARAAIDRIDRELAALFEARMAAAGVIAAEKRRRGLPIRDEVREREVLERGAALLAEPALSPYYRAFQEGLMAQSRAWQAAQGAAADPGDGSPCLSSALRSAGGVPEEHREPSPGFPESPASLSSPVYMERGCLGRAGRLLELDRRVLVLTDEGVPRQYAETLAGQCREAEVFVMPQGEAAKGPETLLAVLETMLRFGMDRHDCLAALGGGVVGDLGGLAAALYMRGIGCYLLPTTVLAMADAALGGKTAVNFRGVKNVLGVFRQPKAVLMDPDVLVTLPPRQTANGLAEIVKMALTHDAALFARFEEPAGYGPMEALLGAALRIKAAVVAADETEQGLRRVLNFGHTLGHGLEAATGGRLLHGECVALGMLPMCAPPVRARLRPVLERLGLPTYVNFELDFDLALEAISHDKKTDGGEIETVFVPEVGSFEFRKVRLDDLKPLLHGLVASS